MNINIKKGQVLQYAFLPQVLPRFKDLISTGFSHLAYFIALVYRATNILPDHHAYLKPQSIGKYTIQNVLTEAANHLTFDFKHIDQLVIFFALIAGIFILAAQFFLLLVGILVSPATAQTLPTGIGEFFITKAPEEDIALRVLDSVFGVPQIFGSKEETETAFHQALHALFQIYSFGLLVVAVIILIYFIFAIIAETAETGTPFGKRYNHVWAPIRLVVGIGLLVPMAFGLNAGQWITLHAAKFGSGFATTGWIIFTDTLNGTPIDKEKLIAKSKVPDLKDLSAFMMMAHACNYAYVHNGNLKEGDIKAWIIKDEDGGQAIEMPKNYLDAAKFLNGKDIYIRFGQQSNEYTDKTSRVYPYCGELVIQNPAPVKFLENGDYNTANHRGTNVMNVQYFSLIYDMWFNNFENIETTAEEYMESRIHNSKAKDPGPEEKTKIVNAANERMQKMADHAVWIDIHGFKEDDKLLKYGWGGAALWYNKIADANGKLTTAVRNKPQIKKAAASMEYTCQKNKQQNKKTSQKDCFNPNLSKGKKMQNMSKLEENVASALSNMFDYWYKNPADLTGNIFIDTINAILGTEGLFDMCENADTHPLAQLSALGKGMIEAAIRNLAISFGTGAAGMLTGFLGPALSAASSFFGTVASIGILIGFILFYIVPFLPFLYFLFAMGGWVKGLFEAMVGVPLWALAHLRIDGEGLPGDAAINGYFLIFEIFLRPILIVFGLIASILIFGAMVKTLNGIFTLVVSNLSGFDPKAAQGICEAGVKRAIQEPGTIEWMRGPIDEFFFTIVYAIIVYMLAMSSFKLIDLIPNNILRWMGQGVQTFNDQRGESAEGLLQKVAIGGSMIGGQLQGALGGAKGIAKGAGDQVKEMLKK